MRNLHRVPVWLGRTMFALASILFLSTSAQAAFIGLAWDPNPEADIAGYVLFYGTTTGNYPNSVDVGNTTTWTGSGLADGQQYFFAVLAYNTTGERSELSEELSARPFAPAQMIAPLPGSALNTPSLQFRWSAGNGVLQYRLSVGTALGGGNLFDQTFATATTATISGVPASGTVFVRLWSLLGETWSFTDYTYSAARPALTITAVNLPEGNSGTQIASFAVKLTPTASSSVTVAYATANGTATAGSDYAAASGTLTIAAGVSTATVNVTVNGDTIVEPDETFTVTLSNPSANAAIGTAQAVGTIRNDDAATTPAAGSSYLSDKAWTSMINGWGPVEKDRSNGETGAADGKALTLNGVTYAKGLGAHAASDVRYALNGACNAFTAFVGVDDEVSSNGAIVFQVWTDGVKKYDSGLMTGSTATASVNVDITGATELALIITDGGNGPSSDHGDWASAQVSCTTDTTAPALTTVRPAAFGSGIALTANVTGVFSEPMMPATFTTATVTLVAQGSTTPLAAAVTYDAASKTVTLDPSANLAGGTLYTATIKGGAAGVKDLAGNPLVASLTWTFTTAVAVPTTTYLSDRAWKSMTNGWGPVEKDRSNGEAAAGDGRVLMLNGVTYAKGLGAHGASDVRYALGGTCSSLTASVGVDDEVGSNGGIVFQVWTDGVKKYDSAMMTGTTATASVNVNVTGATELALIITDGGNGNSFDHGDWANAQITCR